MQDGNNSGSEFVNLTETTPLAQPPQEEAVISSTPPEVEVKKKRSPKIFLIVLAVIVLIGLVGIGGVYAYKTFFLTPEQVISKAYTNLQKIKTSSYKGEMNFNIRLQEADNIASILFPSSFGLMFEGSTDISDIENSKSKLNLDVNVNQTSFANLDLISVDTVSYLRLNSMVDIGSMDFGSIKGVWFKVDPEELAGAYGYSNDYTDVYKLDEEKYKELTKLLTESKTIDITETLKSEEIDGQPTHHYKYSVNKEQLKLLVTKLMGFYSTNYNLPEEYKFDESFNDIFKLINVFEGEIWIGKRDLLPHKFTLLAQVEDKENFKGSFNMNLTMNITDFDKPFILEEPSDFRSFSEVLKELVGGSFEEARDTQRRADLYAITNAIYQYATEHDGNLPGGASFPAVETCIGIAAECFDLASAGSPEMIVPNYIADVPLDPSVGTAENTGYTIFMDSNGRVAAKAKGEVIPEISVIR